MIIDDSHRLAFVHIPKCGGMSVRKELARLDSLKGAFFPVVEHPVLGRIHASHIPLAILSEHFPTEFQKIDRYRAFALVRDPYSRFASAVFQRLMEFRGVPRAEIDGAAALREAHAVTRWLSGKSTFCDIEYIHFSRQCDFLELEGRRVVDNVYSLECIDSMAMEMSRHCGSAVTFSQRENTNFASESIAMAAMRKLKPLYTKLTDWSLRQKVLLLLKRWRIIGPEPLYIRLTDDKDIRLFIEQFYLRDFEIYKEAKLLSAGQ